MPYVSVHVDVSDVIDDLDEDTLVKALAMKRKDRPAPDEDDQTALLEQIRYWAQRQSEIPRCLRDYLWNLKGWVL